MSEEKKHEHSSKKKCCSNGPMGCIGFWKITSLILLVLFVVAVYTDGFSGSKSVSDNDVKTGDYEKEEHDLSIVANVNDMESLIENDQIKGDADAPVTIVEWSDFECPFCARFYRDTYLQIKEEYIDTGKVKFVFRDYPLSFHKQAQKASEAAECAGEQGKYYEMHDILFEQGVAGGVSSFKKFAGDIGLNTEQFNECLDSGRMAEEIAKDMADGGKVGIRGTPGFIINGELVSGAQPFENFKTIIEKKLAE
ncbi:DsbA family protein [Candidatus Woesearchaeota archaeon]|nr:DsbA family protein [Candidatus Woesearchaeota archaeon]